MLSTIKYIFRGAHRVRLGLGVTSGMKLNHIMKLTETAQAEGLFGVWVGDDIDAYHDVFTVASIGLLRFPRIDVGIGITSPLVRNITTIARASVGLFETGGCGRFRLGLGVGGLQQLRNLGLDVKDPEKMMREAVALLRKAWKGLPVSEEDGFSLRNHVPRYGLGYQIPLFFGVRGPRLLKLAGEVSDGVILSGPRTYIEKAVNIVGTGLEERRRAYGKFQRVLWVPTVLVSGPSDTRLVKRIVVFVVVDTPRKVLEMSEIDVEGVNEIKRVYSKHGVAAASKLVSKELLDEVAVFGDSRHVCESFKSLQKIGIDEAVFGPPYGQRPEAAVAELARAWRQHS